MKYVRPSIKKFDYPPIKKRKKLHVVPEDRLTKRRKGLHVVPDEVDRSIKIEPGLDVKRPLPAAGPLRPAQVNDITLQCQLLSQMVVILDCHTESRIPTTEEALRLMDSERPMFGSRYFVSLPHKATVDETQR